MTARPEQIAGWLRLAYPDNEAMQVSHETIYRALYVQARGSLKRELTGHLTREKWHADADEMLALLVRSLPHR